MNIPWIEGQDLQTVEGTLYQTVTRRLYEKEWKTAKIGANELLIRDIIEIMYELMADDKKVGELKLAQEKEKEVHRLIDAVDLERKQINSIQHTIYEKRMDIERKEAEIDHKVKEIQKYNDALQNYESQECRDRIRMAKLFDELVEIQTPQNNTAYIAGLGSILSGCVPMFCDLKDIYENTKKDR